MAGGGSPGFGESPADVLFWLHHANVDRIWAKWHAKHGDPPNFPSTDPHSQLDPWYDIAAKKFSEAQVRDTTLLNYTYDDL